MSSTVYEHYGLAATDQDNEGPLGFPGPVPTGTQFKAADTDTEAPAGATGPFYAGLPLGQRPYGVVAGPTVDTEGYTGLAPLFQEDRLTFSQQSATALSETGIVSLPAAIQVTDLTTLQILALTTDYTLTPSGAGSTKTYSITRVGTSTLSNDNDQVSVQYYYGLTAYFAGVPTFTPATAQAPPLVQYPAGTLDTTTGGGEPLVAGLSQEPGGAGNALGANQAYRAPNTTGVAGADMDTTQTDRLGNQPVDPNTQTLMTGNLDTSYIGAPAAPAPASLGSAVMAGSGSAYTALPQLGIIPSTPVTVTNQGHLTSQTDTITNLVNGTPQALSKTGITTPPSAIIVTDTTAPRAGHVLVNTTDYILTASGSGSTLTYTIKMAASPVNAVSGDNVTVTYFFGNAAFFVPVLLTVTTDYLLQYSGEGPMTTLAVEYVTGGGHIAANDLALVTYSYGTPQYWDSVTPASAPAAPVMGHQAQQADTITLNHTTPAALSQTGITTTPAGLVVFDTTTGKRLALTIDYTVSTTGSGSTKTYSVTRNNASVNSADGNSATVTYQFGNAAYFAVGAISAVNLGVVVGWQQPAGQVETDGYMIQAGYAGEVLYPTGQVDTGTNLNQGDIATTTDIIAINHTTGTPLSQFGIITPASGLVVTFAGQPLTLTTDYTVNTVGSGPTKTYTIQRANSSTKIGDGAQVYVTYSYGLDAGTVGSMYVPFAIAETDHVSINHTTPAQLPRQGIISAPSQLVLTYQPSVPSAYQGVNLAPVTLVLGTDYTLAATGSGPTASYTITRVNTSTAVPENGVVQVSYVYAITSAVFRQGLQQENYIFRILAFNRAGNSPYSDWSDAIQPLNTSAVPTGSLDPANAVNPIYNALGQVHASTNLGQQANAPYDPASLMAFPTPQVN